MWIDYSEELSIGSYLFTLAVAPAIAGGLLLAASLLSWRYCSDTPYFVTGIGFLVISGGLVLASIFVAGFGMIPWILGYLTLGIGQFITLGVLVILSVAPFVSFPFIMISLSSFGSDKGYAFKQNARFSVTTAQSNIKRDSRYLQALEKDRSLVEVRRSSCQNYTANLLLNRLKERCTKASKRIQRIAPRREKPKCCRQGAISISAQARGYFERGSRAYGYRGLPCRGVEKIRQYD